MSHLDEGTLHALLDGELEGNEVAEIQAHLGSCSSCGLRLREVKEFLGEADRLIASVDLGAIAGARAPRLESAPPAAQAAHTDPRVPIRSEPEPRAEQRVPAPPEPTGPGWEPWNEQVPVILVPDNESPAERRRRVTRRFGWAAMVLILISAGVVGRMSRPAPARAPSPTPATLARADSSAVVSPEETGRPDQPAAAQTPKSVSSGFVARPESAGKSVAAAAKPAARRPAPPLAAAAVAPPESRQLANRTAADTSRDEPAQNPDSGAGAGALQDERDTAGTEDLATVRRRASEALAQLDRDKRRNQAAAATAALDAEKRRRAAPAAAPVPTPPAPPTAEERAHVYLRIGLDEALRQLGGPAHVIEGMSPMFMGLAQGVAVPGADATRPVVRVVYQDAQGRLIFLDQQRIRAGQTAPALTPLSWTLGDTAIWLHGEVAGEILRTYRARVR